MSDLPEPLTPPDCDLSGTRWMPFYGDQQLRSDAYLRSTDQEKVVSIELSWAAWRQVPAASLPDDDFIIAGLAGFGRDLKSWMKIRDKVLHDYVKCSDGRLYHRFIAPEAVKTFDYILRSNAKRQTDRDRLQAWRDAKRKKNESESKDETLGGNEYNPGVETLNETQDETHDETRFVDGLPNQTLPNQMNKKERSSLRSPRARTDEDPDFDRFWHAYPRKIAKGQARKAWRAAISKVDPDRIIAVVRAQRFDDRERFIPHPATWLNSERWLDEQQRGDPVLRAVGLGAEGNLLTPDPGWALLQ